MREHTVTAVETDAQDGATHPYGVKVGDAVHFWEGAPPPLSQDYVAPPCANALVLGFSYDARSIWLADLAVVDADGALRIVRGAPQAESFAQVGLADGKLSEPSYGIDASWHRCRPHAS